MTRLCIICEGETERDFVKKLLVPHLQEFCIAAYPSLLKTRSGKQGGGNVSITRLGIHIRNEYPNVDFLTTLVDYYGFKNANNRTKTELEQAILAEAQTRIRQRFDAHYVRPYVQMYEFEGLLFSDISKFALLHEAWNKQSKRKLQRIYDAFETPEDINDGVQTAPSKRLDDIFPGYDNSKILYGPLIAEDIGLDKIRAECPLFNQWIGDLEKLKKRT